MKRYLRIISAILVVTILFSIIPAQAFASEEGTNLPQEQISQEKKEAKILGEVVEKRERNVKHFLKDDGTFEAVVYPGAVHYKDQYGKWKDINNSLTEIKDESGEDVLENKENDFKVKFAKKADSKKLVSVKLGKYEVSWGFDGAKKSEVMKTSKKNKVQQEEIKSSLSDELVAYNIQNDSVIEYKLEYQNLKESIVLNQIPEEKHFDFSYQVKNLTMKLNKDNSVSLLSEQNGEEVFKIDAPFMFDAKNAISQDIKIVLTENIKGYSMSIFPNSNWLSSPERKYPVIIDPTIGYYSPQDVNNNISITTIDKYRPDTNLSICSSQICYKNNFRESRIIFKFLPPNLSNTDEITNVKFSMKAINDEENFHKFKAYSNLSDWNKNSVTWNNAPSISNIVEDFYVLEDGFYKLNWDLTKSYKQSIENNSNFGYTLIDSNDDYNYDRSVYFENQSVVFEYINVSGLEDYWTYYSQDVGRAGTGFVNNFNGNQVFIHNDFSSNSGLMPFSIKHVFNNENINKNSSFGLGWNINFIQKIEPIYLNNSLYYCYTDEDGTKHYFKALDMLPYYDDSGRNMMFNIETENDPSFPYYNSDVFTIKFKDGTKYWFSIYNSKLYKITDSNIRNQIKFIYSNELLTSIIDCVGRVTTFSYQNNQLSRITDSSGRITTYSYSNGFLTQIIYPDGQSSSYNYSAYGMLSAQICQDIKLTIHFQV